MGMGTSEVELRDDFALYFEALEGSTAIPVISLVPTKLPATQPEAVARAAERMRAAAAGELARRQPITVRALPGGRYLILDGNATYGAAIRAGWSSVPATVEAS
jgi:hypothetical protein